MLHKAGTCWPSAFPTFRTSPRRSRSTRPTCLYGAHHIYQLRGFSGLTRRLERQPARLTVKLPGTHPPGDPVHQPDPPRLLDLFTQSLCDQPVLDQLATLLVVRPKVGAYERDACRVLLQVGRDAAEQEDEGVVVSLVGSRFATRGSERTRQVLPSQPLSPSSTKDHAPDSLVPDGIFSKLAPSFVFPLFRLLQVIRSSDELDTEDVIVLLGVLDGVVQVGGESTQVGLVRSAAG